MQKLTHLTLWLLLLTALFTIPSQAKPAYWEYTFRPGDTIWKIAKTYTNSVNNWLKIQQLNQITRGNDRRIKPGERILIPVSMLKIQPAPAVVITTSKNVTLTHKDQSGSTLATGNKLYSGDTIITFSNQFVSLQFADGSILTILPDSTVSMDTLSQFKQTGMIDTQIHLQSGSVDTRVKKQLPDNHYNIITPSAVTAVRGTRFRVASDKKQITRTEVVQGNVAVSAGDSSQQVAAGYGVVAEKGKPISAPVKLLDPPVLRFTSGQRLEWQALSHAQAYRYQLAADTNFNRIISNAVTTGLSVDLSTLEEGNYFARLRGIDKNRLEGMNTQRAITIKHQPPPPKKEPEADIWPLFIPAGVFLLGL